MDNIKGYNSSRDGKVQEMEMFRGWNRSRGGRDQEQSL